MSAKRKRAFVAVTELLTVGAVDALLPFLAATRDTPQAAQEAARRPCPSAVRRSPSASTRMTPTASWSGLSTSARNPALLKRPAARSFSVSPLRANVGAFVDAFSHAER